MRILRAFSGRPRSFLVRVPAWAILAIGSGVAEGALGQEVSAPAAADTNARSALPFRKGQWGAEVTVFTAGSVGLLRFTAPNRAWLLDVAISGSAGNSTDPDGQSRRTGGVSARARVGRRGYRTLLARTGSNSARAAAFATFGGSLSGSWGATNFPTDGRAGSAGLGVFVEVGGTAFVADYLALNASVGAELEGIYASQSFTGVDGGRDRWIDRRISARAGALRVFGSIFF